MLDAKPAPHHCHSTRRDHHRVGGVNGLGLTSNTRKQCLIILHAVPFQSTISEITLLRVSVLTTPCQASHSAAPSSDPAKTSNRPNEPISRKTNYTAGRVVLVGTGEVDYASLVQLAEKHFSSLLVSPKRRCLGPRCTRRQTLWAPKCASRRHDAHCQLFFGCTRTSAGGHQAPRTVHGGRRYSRRLGRRTATAPTQ